MYSFDKGIERRGTSCVKWDESFVGKDVLPMWVADMDFEIAPAITKRLMDVAGKGVFGYQFLSEEYYDAVIVLRIMSVSLIFLSLDNIYGTNYLIVVGEEKTLRNITFISSIIGFACAIPMAYYYSYTGVAIVIVFTRCLMALLITHKALKIKRQKG